MTENTNTQTRRIELYVQSLSPYGARAQQDEIIDRLADLEAADAIDEFELHVWGKYLCPNAAATRTELGQRYVERLERFREWTGRGDRRVAPFLDDHEMGDPYRGESYTAVDVPVLLLAEFDGDELVHVAPCQCDGEVTTVHERVRTLERAAGHLSAADTTTRTTEVGH